jgi:hypothetical protein
LQKRAHRAPLRREDDAAMRGARVAGGIESALSGILSGIRLNEEELSLSTGGLLQLFDQIPVGISISAGPRHRIVYANRLYRKALVPGAGDPVGHEVAALFGDALTPEIYQNRDQAFAEGRVISVHEEPVLPGPDGPVMYWDCTYFPIADERGAIAGLFLFAVDVTEKVVARRLAEERAPRFGRGGDRARHLGMERLGRHRPLVRPPEGDLGTLPAGRSLLRLLAGKPASGRSRDGARKGAAHARP